jgi:hypothetical protein
MSADQPSQQGTRSKQNLRIAIVFFGITRALKLTLPSIEANVIEPARVIARDVKLFGHFYNQTTIANPRSGETGVLDPEEYKLLKLDSVEMEEPGACLDLYPIGDMQAQGDVWEDGFRSFRNLVHQLHSLKRATTLTKDFEPDIVIFARPDLYYHDSMAEEIDRLAHVRRSFVLVPDWSQWWGHNDRFAMVKGSGAIAAYGRRADRMAGFCAAGNQLHSERFLKFALADQRVRTFSLRASRVRSNGLQVLESFKPGRGRSTGGKLVPLGTIR